jgi:fimbrial chaperone protein
MFWGNSRKAALAAFLIYFLTDGAGAGDLAIAPIRVNFAGEQNTYVVRLTNAGKQMTPVQVEAKAWSQTDTGADLYQATDELIAVPPIFRLPPGETQLVRVGFMGAPAADRETTYRLFFTELAPAPASSGEKAQVSMRLRISIPVFVAPTIVARPRVEYVDVQREDGVFKVALRNPGNTHVQIQKLSAMAGLSDDRNFGRASGYLLPGVTRRFSIDVPDDAPVRLIRAETDIAGVADHDMAAYD